MAKRDVRACPKCSSLKLTLKYDEDDDVLHVECDDCGHKWDETPDDKKNVLKQSEALKGKGD
jgi:uncharacterized metal-binding protein (TIGR02443 family)